MSVGDQSGQTSISVYDLVVDGTATFANDPPFSAPDDALAADVCSNERARGGTNRDRPETGFGWALSRVVPTTKQDSPHLRDFAEAAFRVKTDSPHSINHCEFNGVVVSCFQSMVDEIIHFD